MCIQIGADGSRLPSEFVEWSGRWGHAVDLPRRSLGISFGSVIESSVFWIGRPKETSDRGPPSCAAICRSCNYSRLRTGGRAHPRRPRFCAVFRQVASATDCL